MTIQFPRGTAVRITSHDGRFTALGKAQSFLPGRVYSVELSSGHDGLGQPVRIGAIEFYHETVMTAVTALTTVTAPTASSTYAIRFKSTTKLISYQEAFLVEAVTAGLRARSTESNFIVMNAGRDDLTCLYSYTIVFACPANAELTRLESLAAGMKSAVASVIPGFRAYTDCQDLDITDIEVVKT